MIIKRKNDNLITTEDGLTRFSIENLVMLLPLLVAAVYLNGTAALLISAVSVVSAVLCELLCCKIFGMKGSISDLSAVTTGLIIALLLPASCRLWLPALGSVFAIAVAKLPFGGTRRAPFVPAAAGWCFLGVCFSDEVFSFPPVTPGVSPAVYGSEDFVSAQSLSRMLKLGKAVSLNGFGADTLLTGKMPGAMGTTCVLVLCAAAVYLLIRRRTRLTASIGFVAVCAAMAFLFPRTQSGRAASVVCELCAGNLLFTALFIVNEPVTCPHKKPSALLYGATAGMICMLLSYYGKYSDSACYSVLITNAAWPAVEDVRQYIKAAKREKRKRQTKRRNAADNGGFASHDPSSAKRSAPIFESAFAPQVPQQREDTHSTVLPAAADGTQASPAQEQVDISDTVSAIREGKLRSAAQPDPERLKKIEEKFFNEVMRPINQKQSGYMAQARYRDMERRIFSSSPADTDEDADLLSGSYSVELFDDGKGGDGHE